MGEVTAEQIASMINAASKPEPVTIRLPEGPERGVLLIWARHEPTGAWWAGVSYLHKTWHSRALVTRWLPAPDVEPHRTSSYQDVPRLHLGGHVADWPSLPPCYPNAGPDWIAAHRHMPLASHLADTALRPARHELTGKAKRRHR